MPRLDPSAVAALLEPRDRVAAGRTVRIGASSAAVITLGFEVVGMAVGRPGNNLMTIAWATAAGAVLMAAAVTFGRSPHRVPGVAWTALPVFGLALLLSVDLATHDASAAGQVGVFYSVVYAGVHLRPVVAWCVSAVALAVDAVVALTLLPLVDAVADLVVVGSAVVVITLILVRVGSHQDGLTDQLSRLAAVDPLTGLATRRELEAVAATLLRQGEPHRRAYRDLALDPIPRPHAAPRGGGPGLVILDIDRFKLLNDTHGHPVGDSVLAHVARVVREAAPSHATVARLGGDELAVLLPAGPAERVPAVARALLEAVRSAPWRHEGLELEVSVSVGAAHLPSSEGPTMGALYGEADAALYRAKALGRDQVVVAGAGSNPGVS